MFSQTGNRCTVSMRSGLVHNGGAVPPGIAASMGLCLREEGCVEIRMEEGKKKLSNNVAQGIESCWGQDKKLLPHSNPGLPDSCQDVSLLTALQ